MKWSAFVNAGDGFIYGIPSNARYVMKFNTKEKTMGTIGPDLGNVLFKWMCGVLASNGCIYCAPYCADRILKINTVDGTVETLDDVEMPEKGHVLWMSGAAGGDQKIYFMPCYARYILRLDPDTDTVSSVGQDLEEMGNNKYFGTVVGRDNCMYGIPHDARRIVKFDPMVLDPDASISFVGGESDIDFKCGNGVLCSDGYIYALNKTTTQVLKIDTANTNYSWIGEKIRRPESSRWGEPIIGPDQCIYWPCSDSGRILKFDPGAIRQKSPFLVVDDYDHDTGDDDHYGEASTEGCFGGALADDGIIHCFPTNGVCDENGVLEIDPFKEFSTMLTDNFHKHPLELGRIFVEDEEICESMYASSVRKYGAEKVFRLLDELIPLDAICLGKGPRLKTWTQRKSFHPLFTAVTACSKSKNGSLPVAFIYFLVRRNVELLLTE